MSVGAELAAARQACALSIDEIATKTKITRERLLAIEQMGGLWLPSRAHLQHFVGAYAAAVQLDPTATAQRYVAELKLPPLAAPAAGGLPAAAADSELDGFASEGQSDSDALFASETVAVARQPVADDRARRPERVAPANPLNPAWDARPIREPHAAETAPPDVAPIAEPDVVPTPEPDVLPTSGPDRSPIAQPDIAPLDEPDMRPVNRDADVSRLDEDDVPSLQDYYARPRREVLFSAPPPSRRRYAPVVLVAALALLGGWVLSANLDNITAGSMQGSARPSIAPANDKATAADDAARADTPEHVAMAAPAVSSPPVARSEVTPSSEVATATDCRPDVESNASRASAVKPESAPAPASAPPVGGANDRAAAVTAPPVDRANERTATTPVTAPERAPAGTPAPATNTPAPTPSSSGPLSARTIAPSAPAATRDTNADQTGESKNREAGNTDVSGWWAVTNRVESANVEAFENLNLGFHLQLQQRGNRVTGTGEKWMENGRRIPPGSRARIAVEGTLTGDRLELNFTEHGSQRTSTGSFVLNVTDDGLLRGSFVSDAANAQGTSLARRMESPSR